MADETTDQTEDDKSMSSGMLWVITFVGVIAAAAPHAFFPPPLELHMMGDLQAWLGISVWAPAILAGVAFFFGVEFGARFRPKRVPIERAAVATVVIYLLHLSYLAEALELRWTQMEGMRPWGELQTALPLYLVLGALLPLFWQGFVQHRVMSALSTGLRVVLVSVLSFAVYVPFLFTGAHDDNGVFVGIMALEGFSAALLFETGVPTWGIMIFRGMCGLAFIWFQQSLLL